MGWLLGDDNKQNREQMHSLWKVHVPIPPSLIMVSHHLSNLRWHPESDKLNIPSMHRSQRLPVTPLGQVQLPL